MVLPPAVEEQAARLFAATGGQSVFTYLANRLERVVDGTPSEPAQQVPYSTLAAIDLSPAFSLRNVDGQVLQTPGPDEIVLTDWAAEQMRRTGGRYDRGDLFRTRDNPWCFGRKSADVSRVWRSRRLCLPTEPYLPDQKLVFAQRRRWPTIRT